MNLSSKKANEKGSLALEQVLFIGAVVAISAGLIAFYGSMSGYFQEFSETVDNLSTDIPGQTGTGGSTDGSDTGTGG